MKFSIFALVLTLALWACSPSHSRTIRMQASIPFDFIAGDILMPAGDYVLIYSASRQLQIIGRQDATQTAAVFTMPPSRIEKPEQIPPQGLLEFNQYGANYFLAKIWTPNGECGGSLRKSSMEKEIARRTDTVQMATVALSGSDEIELR